MDAYSIVDSHVHFWDPARLEYPWLGGLPELNRAFLPADFAKASAGSNVAKIIFVEGGCRSTQGLAEVFWVSDLAKVEPRLRGVVAHAPLEKGGAVLAELTALISHPLVKGVRRSLQDEADLDFCVRREFVSGVKLLAQFGFTFDTCVRHDQLPGLTELARRAPEVTFVLDHFGKPNVRAGQTGPWAKDIMKLAALPNVVCKISGLTTEGDWHHWRPEELRFYFEAAFEYFGFDRVLFGGDWPVATLATTYGRWVEVVQDMVSNADDRDRTKLFQTNVERIYRV